MNSLAIKRLKSVLGSISIETRGTMVVNLFQEYAGIVNDELLFTKALNGRDNVLEAEWRWRLGYRLSVEADTGLRIVAFVTDIYPDGRTRFQSHVVLTPGQITDIDVFPLRIKSIKANYIDPGQLLFRLTVRLASSVQAQVIAEPVFLISPTAQSLPLQAVHILFSDLQAAQDAENALKMLVSEEREMNAHQTTQSSWDDVLSRMSQAEPVKPETSTPALGKAAGERRKRSDALVAHVGGLAEERDRKRRELESQIESIAIGRERFLVMLGQEGQIDLRSIREGERRQREEGAYYNYLQALHAKVVDDSASVVAHVKKVLELSNHPGLRLRAIILRELRHGNHWVVSVDTREVGCGVVERNSSPGGVLRGMDPKRQIIHSRDKDRFATKKDDESAGDEPKK